MTKLAEEKLLKRLTKDLALVCDIVHDRDIAHSTKQHSDAMELLYLISHARALVEKI
jgi:hypothetical protein